MRLGIFHKILAVFIIITIFTFTIISGILYFFLDEFFVKENIGNLESGVEKVSDAFKDYFLSYYEYDKMDLSLSLQLKRIIWLSFNANLQYISEMTESHIWIVTGEGKVYFSYPELPASVKNRYTGTDGRVRLPVQNQYLKLLNNEENIFVELGDFYGFFSEEAYNYAGDTWLTYGKKFDLGIYDQLYAGNNGTYLIYMHMPASEIKETQGKVFVYLWISILISSILAFVLIYLITKRLTNPIKQMNKMSKIIASGKFTGRLNISSKDEIGELAGSFNQMIVALERNESMRTRFVSNVSHELRTPMTTIKGFVEGILDGTIPGEKQEYYLNIVKDEVDRLTRLVNDLLTLSRLDAEGMKIKFDDFDMHETIRRCVINLGSLIEQKSLDMNIRFCEEYLYVNANKDSIGRVIYNLLHNAIKFSHPNGVVTIITTVSGNKAEITIEDYGVGIEKEELENIWDRFYTVDKSRSMDNTGTGLGLSIIKNVLDVHNQTIKVESEPGRGTKFQFTLSLAKQRMK